MSIVIMCTEILALNNTSTYDSLHNSKLTDSYHNYNTLLHFNLVFTVPDPCVTSNNMTCYFITNFG